MSRLESLSPRWGEISALLDEALALPPAERSQWLASLAGVRAELKDTLHELLGAQAAVETNDFLATLPHLQDAPASSAPHADASAGMQVGPYRLVSELGRGGMGSVWLAERADGQLKRRVALKLPRLAWGSALAERLARERDILASLEHPHVARLYDAGVDAQGRPYFAMEWIDGRPIDTWCAEHAASVPERLRLLGQVCEAVAHAHSRLVVHRDLKPGNILVTGAGEVRLLDFGIAKLMEGDRTAETALTELSGRALTRDYASPEQVAGEPLGTASDVYSLGVVAFELLAGARPYRLKRGSAAELEEAIAGVDAPRASDVATSPALKRALRGDLDAILNKALQKKPAQRYGTVVEFAEDLRRHRDGDPVLARPESRLYRLRKFVARNRLAVGASGAVALALIAASAVSLWQARLAQQQAQRALAVQAFLTDIFRTNTINQRDPLKARQTTARELLDIGAQRIDRNLQGDPEGRAEILGLLSEMYFDLGLDPESAEFYGRRADELKRAFGARDRRVAMALAQYAMRLDLLGRDDAQKRALDEAGAILDALGDTTSEARAQLLEALAKANALDAPKAVAFAEQAVALYRRHHPRSDAFAGALNRLGIARTTVDDHAGAEAAFIESLDLLQRDPGNHGSAIITGSLMLAGAQARLQKVAAAEETYRRTLADTLQRNGARHIDTLYVQAWFGWFLHRTARRDEAWQLLQAAVAEVRREAYPPFFTRTVRMHANYALCAEGRFDEAAPEIDWLIGQFGGYADGRNWMTALLLRQRAEQQLSAGRLADAQRSLADAREVHDALTLRQRRGVGHGIALTEARIALASGRPERVQEILANRPPRADGERAVLQPEDLTAQALQAEALLRQGRAAESRAAAEEALGHLDRSGLREYLQAEEADVLLPLGRALQREGRLADACPALERAVRLRLTSLGARSPRVSEAELALADCLRGDGRRAQAEALPASAEARRSTPR